jgi:uncharacterized protein
VCDSVEELARVRAIEPVATLKRPPAKVLPLTPVPLSTMVMNVTNQCNLACTYCYEYSEDKIVDTENGRQPKWMTEETARQSVDFLLRESGPIAHVTFFGGETLLNFRVVQSAVAYAKARAADLHKDIDFSITTNATLLKPEVIEFLAEHRFGVTISIDGPPELQDKFRVFHNGSGSYHVVAPKIRELLVRHRTRPIGARVTLTRDTIDVRRIFDHLTNEMGFWEVGFAPATTAPGRAYAVGSDGFDSLLAQFRDLAADYRDAAIENRHRFSNVHETIDEIHRAPTNRGRVGPGWGFSACRRAATSGSAIASRLRRSSTRERARRNRPWDAGGVSRGAPRRGQAGLPSCWARPLCAGGCYHEAHTRYGNTNHANLHYCEWIRGWTDTCLQVYGEIAERNPGFLKQFEGSYEAPQPS